MRAVLFRPEDFNGELIRVFIGYDPREAIAYHVLCHSILEWASVPVSITPIKKNQLPLTRAVDPKQTNEFSFTRFLVPWLCHYQGSAIFMDCDMMFRDDIKKLWQERSYDNDVQVVKHDHRPKEKVKYLNNPQSQYVKKNWSSVMLFNNALCRVLTPDYINRATGLELHQFQWAASVGDISHRWNHLVDYDQYDPDAGNVHFTTGGPWFNEYRDCGYADEWRDMLNFHNHCEQCKK